MPSARAHARYISRTAPAIAMLKSPRIWIYRTLRSADTSHAPFWPSWNTPEWNEARRKKMGLRIAPWNSKEEKGIHAEAAVWGSQLHRPDRDRNLEARVLRWIAENRRHAAAFESITDAWKWSDNIPWHRLPPVSGSARGHKRPSIAGAALAGMATLCAALACTIYFLRDDTLA